VNIRSVTRLFLLDDLVRLRCSPSWFGLVVGFEPSMGEKGGVVIFRPQDQDPLSWVEVELLELVPGQMEVLYC
jgi:hypothetical protein